MQYNRGDAQHVIQIQMDMGTYLKHSTLVFQKYLPEKFCCLSSISAIFFLFEINNLNLSYSFANERSEDLAISYADVTLAQELLDWSSEHSLEDMCKDSWRSICI